MTWRLFVLAVFLASAAAAEAAAPGRDIDHFYASRLPNEPLEGVTDIHTHPLEPFTVRASFAATF